jgi:Flp pilus assembly pilin Flp
MPRDHDDQTVHFSNVIVTVLSSVSARARSEQGQTMPEYGLLIAVIALVVIGVAVLLGADISSVFGRTGSYV